MKCGDKFDQAEAQLSNLMGKKVEVEEIEKVILDTLDLKEIAGLGCSGIYLSRGGIKNLASAIAAKINGE